MIETSRLTIFKEKSQEHLDELWQNCFAGEANSNYMNAHVPYPVLEQTILDAFLKREMNYRTWLVKRKEEGDIIGFIVHGDFFPGHTNNIGFNIGLGYSNNGYAKEALKKLVDLLSTEGWGETYGHCFFSNAASIKVMEDCGFQSEGPTGRKFYNNIELKFKKSLNSQDWLMNDAVLNGPLPIETILNNSLYYPGSGFDGRVIKYCNKKAKLLRIDSFIYCDYGVGLGALEERKEDFIGYSVLSSRDVNINELIPNGWVPTLPPGFNLEGYQRFKDMWQRPFCKWIVYQRDQNKGDVHGPKRFSLVYLGGEGVATYQALYGTNHKSAKVLVVFEHGFSGNWTKFDQENNELHWVISQNPNSYVNYIFYNGEFLNWADYRKIENTEHFSIWQHVKLNNET